MIPKPLWSDIDTVLFDMDGTLLDLNFDNYFWLQLVPQHYSEAHGVSFEAAREIITCKYAEVRGTLSWYCLDYWQQELSLDVSGLKSTVRHRIALRPNVEHFLGALRDHDKKLVLVTNAHPHSLALKMDQSGIASYFDQRVSSHELRLAKENHGFWERLQQLTHYEPDRTMLIDDSLPVLRQARREGIAHLFGIRTPDSQRPPLDHDEFPMIDDFASITPEPNERSA